MIFSGRKTAAVLLTLCVTAVTAFAQTAASAADGTATAVSAGNTSSSVRLITVADAVKLASEGNVGIKQAVISTQTAKRSYDTSWNSVSPSIDVSGRSTTSTSSPGSSVTTYGAAALSFSFAPSLFTTIETARLNYEEGKISEEQERRTIELSVRQSFYGLLYEQENINLQQRNLETAQKQYEQNLSKYKSGAISQLDVLSAQVTAEKLKPTLQSAQVTWQNDMASFKQLLGLDQNTQIQLDGSLDDVLSTGKVDLSKVTVNSLSVQSLEKQLAAAQTAVLAKRFSAYGPTVSAGVTWQPTTTSADTSKWTDNGSAYVGVSIPLDGLLPWSSGAVSIAAAKDTAADLELQLAAAKTTLEVDTQSYLRQIEQAQTAVQSFKASIDLAQQTYDMTLIAYNRGTKDLLSLQNASDSLLEAKVNLASEAYTLAKAVLNLENTIGVPFGTLGR